MSVRKFTNNKRVALESDIKHRGIITYVYPPAYGGSNDTEIYFVQWDKSGSYLYPPAALITEEEANEIQAKRDEEKKKIENKFKAMENASSETVK